MMVCACGHTREMHDRPAAPTAPPPCRCGCPFWAPRDRVTPGEIKPYDGHEIKRVTLPDQRDRT